MERSRGDGCAGGIRDVAEAGERVGEVVDTKGVCWAGGGASYIIDWKYSHIKIKPDDFVLATLILFRQNNLRVSYKAF